MAQLAGVSTEEYEDFLVWLHRSARWMGDVYKRQEDARRNLYNMDAVFVSAGIF